MRASIRIDKPGEIPATLTLTMTLDQFREVRKGLKSAPFYGPAQWLREAIDVLESQASTCFRHDEERADGASS